MVKVLNQYIPTRLFLLVVSENALIVLGVWLAVSLNIGSFRLDLLSYPVLLGKALLVMAICQVCFYFNDLYDLKAIRSHLQVFVRLLNTLGMASLILALLYLLVPPARLGSGIAEISVIAIALIILLWRVMVEWFHRVHGAKERILVIGSGPMAQAVVRHMRSRPDLPMEITGLVGGNGSMSSETTSLGFPYLGGLDTISQICQRTEPDRIVIALEDRRAHLPVESLLKLRLRGVRIEDASGLCQKLAGRVPLDAMRPSDVIFSEVFYKPPRTAALRRLIGAGGALLALLLFGPLMAVIAVAIKLDSPGTVLYRQPRVGLDGRVFEMLKFRSMRADAESTTGPTWADPNDPRITRVGRVLRRLRLDELPQLINVLRGDMFFIGPRPERPYFVDRLRHEIPFYDVRHVVTPGLTGWAQVSCGYGSSVAETREKLEFDLFYLKNRSVSLDLVILFRTFKIALFGRGAR